MANDCLYSSKPPTHTHTHTHRTPPSPSPNTHKHGLKCGNRSISWRHQVYFTGNSAVWQLTCYLHSNRDEHKVWSPPQKKKKKKKKKFTQAHDFPAIIQSTHILWEVLHDLYMYLLISGGIWDFARSNVHPFNEATTHSWASLTPWVTTMFIHLSVRMLEPTVFSIMFHKQQ